MGCRDYIGALRDVSRGQAVMPHSIRRSLGLFLPVQNRSSGLARECTKAGLCDRKVQRHSRAPNPEPSSLGFVPEPQLSPKP